MILEKPRWKIEVLASRHPLEEWMPLRHESGRRFRYVEYAEAEAAVRRLKRVQPHMELRIAPA